jgi:hypothetical protein
MKKNTHKLRPYKLPTAFFLGTLPFESVVVFFQAQFDRVVVSRNARVLNGFG